LAQASLLSFEAVMVLVETAEPLSGQEILDRREAMEIPVPQVPSELTAAEQPVAIREIRATLVQQVLRDQQELPVRLRFFSMLLLQVELAALRVWAALREIRVMPVRRGIAAATV
jgi:hypothetical protein